MYFAQNRDQIIGTIHDYGGRNARLNRGITVIAQSVADGNGMF
jgi:hypothetical protein